MSAMTAEKKVASTEVWQWQAYVHACRCIPTGTEEPLFGVVSRLTLAHC